MKKFKLLSIAILLFFAYAKGTAQTKQIDIAKSKITWTGKKITGEHIGTVNLKEGYLVFKDKVIVGGSFTMDMTSISNTDQTGESKSKLEKHLKSEDFFGVDKYPTATLLFKNVAEKGKNVYVINADLTVKGITKPQQFELTVKGKTATTHLVINRIHYDIKYSSGSFFDDLADKTIYDEFEIDVELLF